MKRFFTICNIFTTNFASLKPNQSKALNQIFISEKHIIFESSTNSEYIIT